MKSIYVGRPLTKSEKNKRFYDSHRENELERNRKYIDKNRKKVNARIRLYNHKMTVEEHDKLLKKQKNRCAICRKKFRKTPHIDHSHVTGKNRGLLCDDCNLGLGRFKDSVKVLGKAIIYLKQCKRTR
jgi:hypothetical protein